MRGKVPRYFMKFKCRVGDGLSATASLSPEVSAVFYKDIKIGAMP